MTTSEVPTCYLPHGCLGLHAHSPSSLSVVNAPFLQKTMRFRNAGKSGQGCLASSAHTLSTTLHLLPNSGKHVEIQLQNTRNLRTPVTGQYTRLRLLIWFKRSFVFRYIPFLREQNKIDPGRLRGLTITVDLTSLTITWLIYYLKTCLWGVSKEL